MQLTTKRSLTALVTGALLVAGVGSARAGDGGGYDYAGPVHCTDASRACVLEAADTYLVAMRAHDGDLARLAPRILRTRNAGEQTPEEREYTDDEMADSLDEHEKPVTAVHSIDWVVDGDNAIAFYAIDASYEERGYQAASTWLAERIHVTDGLIDEIEAIFFIGAQGLGNTNRGWLTPPAAPADRATIEAAAKGYFNSQVNGGAADTLADDVRRTFNGKETGRTRPVVETVTAPFGPATYDVRMTRWYVDVTTGDAVVFAALDEGAADSHVSTVLFAQRLRVTNGLVNEIEQIAWPLPGSEPTPTGWES